MTPEEKTKLEKDAMAAGLRVDTRDADTSTGVLQSPAAIQEESSKPLDNRIQVTETGELYVTLDLATNSYPFCLGFAVLVTDAIKKWYMSQEMKKQQRIVKPTDGVLAGLKSSAGMLKKLFH